MSEEPAADADRSRLVARLLAAAATTAGIAARLEPPGLERILRSVVEATADLFDAEAASIALLEPDGRLRFRVAAGERGQGVVGLIVESGQGVAGYVAATGQPLALADVAQDPRFGRETAQATGYLPDSLLAVPLELDDRVIGVLEVLDRRGNRPFDLADVARAGVFARQAAVAIDAWRVDDGIGRLLLDALARIAAAGPVAAPADEAELGRLVTESLAGIDDGGPAFWSLVDRIAAVRAADPARLALVADLLEVTLAHLGGGTRRAAEGRHGASGPSWRDRAGLRDDGDEL
jgi:hypothetical protein